MIKTLTKKRDFEKLQKQGVKWNTPCFTIVAAPDFDDNYLGIIASKRNISNLAVIRNRVKRQIREIYRNNTDVLEKNTAYLIILKKDFTDTEFTKLNEEFLSTIKKVNKQLKEKSN